MNVGTGILTKNVGVNNWCCCNTVFSHLQKHIILSTNTTRKTEDYIE